MDRLRRPPPRPSHDRRLGRGGRAYSYIRILIVAGIIVVAVGGELVLVHPGGHVEPGAMAEVLGGAAVYLFGYLLSKRTVAARAPLSHLIGLVLLVPAAAQLQPLLLGAAASEVLVTVADLGDCFAALAAASNCERMTEAPEDLKELIEVGHETGLQSARIGTR